MECVCVCVCERERERKRKKERERESVCKYSFIITIIYNLIIYTSLLVSVLKRPVLFLSFINHCIVLNIIAGHPLHVADNFNMATYLCH